MDPRAWARITFAVTSLTTAMNSTPLKTSSAPSLASIPTIPDVILRKARMYQEYMQMVPLPTRKSSLIPCNSWMGLAASTKELYGQPLHHLTNLSMKQWDYLRIGANDEDVPLDTLIDPAKAEASIWLIEEMHRNTTSPFFIARLWHGDPMYHVYIDAIFPELKDPSK